MRWATAVKLWNENQIFKDDLYGIPKKGGIYYDEIKEIVGSTNYQKTVASMMGKPLSEAKSEDDEDLNRGPVLPTAIYSKSDLQGNFQKAREKLFVGSHQEKLEAIQVLLDLTKSTTPLADRASKFLEDIRTTPKQLRGIGIAAPGSGKSHKGAESMVDFSDIVHLIPPQSSAALQRAVKAERLRDKSQGKAFEKSRSETKEAIKESFASQKQAMDSPQSVVIRRIFGQYPEKKLFSILQEYGVEDALDFRKKLEMIKRKHPSFPERLENVYGLNVWVEYDDFKTFG